MMEIQAREMDVVLLVRQKKILVVDEAEADDDEVAVVDELDARLLLQ